MSTPLGERVRLLCDLAGIGREALSGLCGLAPGHLGLIVNGRIASVTDATIRRICEKTGVSVSWLVAGHEPVPTEEEVRAAVAVARAASAEGAQGAA